MSSNYSYTNQVNGISYNNPWSHVQLIVGPSFSRDGANINVYDAESNLSDGVKLIASYGSLPSSKFLNIVILLYMWWFFYFKDCGLFEAVQITNPVLPQYHPKQLLELLNFGKVNSMFV